MIAIHMTSEVCPVRHQPHLFGERSADEIDKSGKRRITLHSLNHLELMTKEDLQTAIPQPWQNATMSFVESGANHSQ